MSSYVGASEATIIIKYEWKGVSKSEAAVWLMVVVERVFVVVGGGGVKTEPGLLDETIRKLVNRSYKVSIFFVTTKKSTVICWVSTITKINIHFKYPNSLKPFIPGRPWCIFDKSTYSQKYRWDKV